MECICFHDLSDLALLNFLKIVNNNRYVVEYIIVILTLITS